MTEATFPVPRMPPLAVRVIATLLVLLGSLPFLIPWHVMPIPSFYSEICAFVLGFAALLAVMFGCARSGQPLRFPVSATIPIGLALIAPLQLALGRGALWEFSLTAILYLVFALALMVAGASVAHGLSERFLHRYLALGLLAGGLLTCATMVWQRYGWRDLALVMPPSRIQVAFGESKVVAYGNLGQINHLAAYLALALIALMYCHAARIATARFTIISALALVTALFTSGQRSALVYALLVTVIAFAGFASRGIPLAHRRRLLPFAGVFPAFVLAEVLATIVVAKGRPVASSTQRLLGGFEGKSDRVEYIREAMAIWADHPVLGSGYGTFGGWHFALAERFPVNPGLGNHSHNIIANLAAECGLLGVVMLVIPLSIWIWHLPWARPNLRLMFVGGGVAVMLLHSLVEYPLWHTYFLGLMAILVGANERRQHAWPIPARWPVLVIATAVMLVLGIVAVFQYRDMATWMSNNRFGSQRDQRDWPAQLRAFEANPILGPTVQRLTLRAIPINQKTATVRLAASERVMKLEPGPYEAYDHALTLGFAGKPQEAIDTLKAARIRYPEYSQRIAAEWAMLDGAEVAALLALLVQAP